MVRNDGKGTRRTAWKAGSLARATRPTRDPRVTNGGVAIGADEFFAHLYHTGSSSPGQTMKVKTIGAPTSPAFLAISVGELPAPVPLPGLLRIQPPDPRWEGRRQFFFAAARAMRDILIDQARARRSLKRGGDREREPLDSGMAAIESPHEEVVALDEAIEKLGEQDPRKAEIARLRYYAGLSRTDIATTLGVTTRTVDREWNLIVAHLHRLLNPR